MYESQSFFQLRKRSMPGVGNGVDVSPTSSPKYTHSRSAVSAKKSGRWSSSLSNANARIGSPVGPDGTEGHTNWVDAVSSTATGAASPPRSLRDTKILPVRSTIATSSAPSGGDTSDVEASTPRSTSVGGMPTTSTDDAAPPTGGAAGVPAGVASASAIRAAAGHCSSWAAGRVCAATTRLSQPSLDRTAR